MAIFITSKRDNDTVVFIQYKYDFSAIDVSKHK